MAVPGPTVHFSGRRFATSVKAILQARHANTKRGKRHRSGEWMREIVVKTYCQMDSLREVLDKPARRRGRRVEVEVLEVEDEEDCAGVEDGEPAGGSGPGVKRKLTEMERILNQQRRERESKRRKVGEGFEYVSVEPDLALSEGPLSSSNAQDAAKETIVIDDDDAVGNAGEQREGYYTWPALMNRVSTQFPSMTSPLIETPS